MEQYLSGSVIIERYNLAPFQLGLLINMGATPLSPLTSEPLLCLTEPESWLHDLNAAVLEATGLLLILWETFPKLPDINNISKNSFIILVSYPLYKLSANNVTQGLLEDESPIERESKGFFWPLTGLFSKSSYPKAYRTAFFHTSALLRSANGSKSVWPLLQKINDSNDKWLKLHHRFFKGPLTSRYENFLSQFFFEQTHGQIEHPQLRKRLDEFSPFIQKLQAFTLNYWETSSTIISDRKTKNTNFDPSTWAISANMLANWESGTNLHRLNALAAIIQDLRKDFRQVHFPWEQPIKVTQMEEAVHTLESAVFERQSIEKICGDILIQPFEIKDKDDFRGRETAEKSALPDKTPVSQETPQTEAMPPPAVTSETPTHWATIYRAHKGLTTDQDEKDAWEIMALRLEGLTGYDIYKKVFPGKAKQTQIGTAKAHISRTVRNRGLRLLKEAGLPVLPQLMPGKKEKP